MQIKAKVTACFGNQAQIFSDEKPNLPICQLKKNLHLVAGEEILCEIKNNQAVFVKKISSAENTKYFYRYSKQNLKALSANIDQLLIVCANLPEPQSILIDSFLVLAENQGLSASLVFNKSDLNMSDSTKKLIEVYKNLEYPFFLVSAKTGAGLDMLKKNLKNKNTAFCGASGVGKSSLLNTFIKKAHAKTGDIGKSRGRHTTSAAQLYISDDYNLTDLPGANKILPDKLPKAKILQGYKELRSFLNLCKFSDCNHSGDLGCKIQLALDEGKIDPMRWQNMQKLLQN